MKKSFILIIAAGLLLRLAAFYYYSRLPLSGGGDDVVYCGLAQSIRAGQGFSFEGGPLAQRGPVYPLFLAAVGGPAIAVDRVRLAQVAVSGITIGLAGALAGVAFCPLAGYGAAALLALDAEHILLPTSLYTECLYSLLLAFLLAAFLFWDKKPSLKTAALAGCVLGVCALCRSFILPFGVIAAWLVLRRPQVAVAAKKQAVIFAVITILCLLPWVYRNYRVFHRILPVEAGLSGPVFYYASAGYITAPEREDGEEPFKTVARTMPHWQWDGIMYRYGLQNILRQPGRYIASTFSRAWYLWDETYVAYLLFYNPAARAFALARWPLINMAGKVCLVVLFGLAFYGFWCNRRNIAAQLALALLLYFNCYAFFAVFVRFAAPAALPLMILAGAGLASLIACLNRL